MYNLASSWECTPDILDTLSVIRMKKSEIDIKGSFKLLDISLFKNGIPNEHWAHCNIKGLKREDSHLLYLDCNKPKLIGEICKSQLRYKFRESENFRILLNIGNIIELNIGSIKYGEFVIEEIVNTDFVAKLTKLNSRIVSNDIMKTYLDSLGYAFQDQNIKLPEELTEILESKFITNNDCVTLDETNSLCKNPIREADNDKTEWEYNESKIHIEDFIVDTKSEINYLKIGLEFIKQLSIKLLNEFHDKQFIISLSFYETEYVDNEINAYGSAVARFYQKREKTTWYRTNNLNSFESEAIIMIETK